ncbi:MAG TPA: DNA methyltransferase [Thermotogota bacterium]|nr:DNA methyltransferase [Thermotogota bacterium]
MFDAEIPITRDTGPVTCLGLTFPNDEERRKHFLGILREKLKDPDFRKIEGFPIGEDEDILALSDPPYYTACPNPFLAEWIVEPASSRLSASSRLDVSTPYHREPFAADVSEGKNDPIYNAHSYHTKVPHKAIMRYILHYTEPGDIVFDGFCGTGMTGVAAQMCGDKTVVESLGYKVENDGTVSQQETDENGKNIWKSFSKLGARRAVLNDLSPAATFIAYNYNTPVDVQAFEREAKRILKEVEDECGWMYETLHVEPASSRLISALEFTPCDPFKTEKGTYRKDNLPHIQVPGATYFITFRTHEFRVLSPEARRIALNSLCHWDDQRWKLFSAVVMPDHVHIIAKPLLKQDEQYWDLSEVLHSVKSFSANEINKSEEKTGTPVWQTESYDRVIRDAYELGNELAYLNHNPIKARLVNNAEAYDWRYVAGELITAGWKPALLGKINYTVWSDVFVCPDCTREVIFWEAAVDKEAGKVLDEFPCPHCGAMLTKRRMERAWLNKYDTALKQTIRQAKQVPVLINYTVGPASSGVEPASSRLKRYEKKPDHFDLTLIEKIERTEIPYWYPTVELPDGFNTRQPKVSHGITHVHHFYTKRNLYILSAIRRRCSSHILVLWFNSQLINLSKLNRYRPEISFPYNPLNGTLYIGSQISEADVFVAYSNKTKRLCTAFKDVTTNALVSTCSADATFDAQFDYLFLDPPFGSNINYSELSSIWESWLKVWTNNKSEAIENTVQKKGPNEYRRLMTACFREAYRVLKPGRWMTVEFSNTQASVWNSIQTAITDAGFIVANVSALDKQQGSFKAVTTPTAVKQDLVISAYKPNGGFEERFEELCRRQDAGATAGATEGVWDFVRTHLNYLPVVKRRAGFQPADINNLPTDINNPPADINNQGKAGRMPALLAVAERDPRILYDQMVAYYVRKGYPVPLNSAEFQEGLSQRFSYRDGMYFLPDQVAEYDKKKMAAGGIEQMSLFVHDESSAIAWLRQFLKGKPQTFQDIHPVFIKELGGWQKHEKPLELSELLEQNFLRYDGKGEVPNQIHSYLSTNFKELRNLPKDNESLRAKGKDRWYVPDPNKAGDLEKLRERSLLTEFQEYVALASSQRRLKVFRLEAIRAGFKKAWQERDYAIIIAVARKIPEAILQEDPKLLMWYDQALTRSGGE